MWSTQELDEEWLACVTGVADGEWPAWATGAAGEDWPERPGEPPGPSSAGTGFAAGGLLDGLAPGAVLAGFAQNAWADGLGGLSDDALVGVLQAWRRLASWAAAGELAAVAELNERRWAEVAAGADPHLAEHVGDEVAAALTLTTRSADALVDMAAGLARLRRTATALAAGQIDRTRALVIIDGVTGLRGAHAAAVEAAVLGRAPGQTSGQVRAATARAVLAADPSAADRRRQEARQQARVEVWDERSGTAALAGRDLPPAGVLAADKRIDALAWQLKSAGRAESLSQLRAEVYLALLQGQAADGPGSGAPPGPAATGAGSGHGQDASAGPGGHALGAASAPKEQDASATPAGHAPGAASAPREVAGPAPAGPAVAGASDTRPARAGLAAAGPAGPGPASAGLAAAGPASPGPAPAGLGLAGSVNLTMPMATWLGASAEPGEAAGFGPLPADDARALADLLARRPGARWCLTLTGPDGRAIAHGCARAGQHPAGRDRPDGRGQAAARAGPGEDWALTVTIRPLAAGECSHARQSHGYQPPPALRHLITIRDRTCCFPGCRNPAARCDQDHTLPHLQGGRTCECNLACLCRRHHQAKQAHGWRLDQPEPGVLLWRLPHGRSYRVEPPRYPD